MESRSTPKSTLASTFFLRPRFFLFPWISFTCRDSSSSIPVCLGRLASVKLSSFREIY